MMLGPRITAAVRPCTSRAPQCLRQQARRIPRTTIQDCIRHRRFAQTNSKGGYTFLNGLTTLWKAYPFSVTLALVSITFGAGTLVWINEYYRSVIIESLHQFPEPVAKEMRKALFYTNMDLQPKLAVKHYKAALQAADETGMNPFSDEILGIKIQLAAFMEMINQHQKAITVLELVKTDCLKWINQLGGKPGNEADRTRILGKAVQMSVKLAELYSNEHVAEDEKAEENLVYVVETVLKERKRRDEKGVIEDSKEGHWLSDDQIGASFEALGHDYEGKNQHHLAAPLFLQALTYSPSSSCHTAVLMNNLAISLAQQDPPPTPGQPPISRSALVGNARLWAQKSLAAAAKIKPPERTEECDIGCAVATHNLGEFAEMDGDIVEARRRYEEAKSLAKAIGFENGVSNAEDGLKRLSSK